MVSCRAQKELALVSRRVCAKAAGRASDLHVLGVAHQPPAKRHEVGLLHVLNLLVICHTFCVVENSTQGEENADYQEMRRGNACLPEEIACVRRICSLLIFGSGSGEKVLHKQTSLHHGGENKRTTTK